MKKTTLIALLIIAIAANGFARGGLSTRIKFASIEKANKLLTTADDFTNSWSQFDIDSRMHKKNSSKDELFAYIPTQTRDWTEEEKAKILSAFESIEAQIKNEEFHIKLPKEIYLVKTTTKEEGGAGGYTRANYIVVKDNVSSMKTDALKQFIAHEFFHILTRYDKDFRRKMYSIIGFELMNSIKYPDNIRNYRVTNPDATQTDNFIKLSVEGQNTVCTMVLYSKEDYNEGELFKYLNVGFLKLRGDKEKQVELIDNKPRIYTIKEVSDFFEQVGRNTKYIIHPEEILAENFKFLFTNKTELPNQNIVEMIRKRLKE